jgi:hypothetical protein
MMYSTMDPELVRLAVEVPATFRRALRSLALEHSTHGKELTMGDIVFALLTGQPCPVTMRDFRETFRRLQARESGGQSGQQRGRKSD